MMRSMSTPMTAMPPDHNDAAPGHSIVFVGPDGAPAAQIRHALDGLPWPVRPVGSEEELFNVLRDNPSGCVVAQVADPHAAHLLQFNLRTSGGNWLLIVITPQTDIDVAVAALKTGAHDLIELPVVERVLRQRVAAAMHSLD